MVLHLNIFLPIALVIMAFLLKLFMDQSATIPLFIRSLYEVPVNVVFLALSFTTAFTISAVQNTSSGMFHIYFLFIVALINVVCWRRSVTLFESSHHFWSAVVFVINGVLSGYSLYRAIELLVPEVVK